MNLLSSIRLWFTKITENPKQVNQSTQLGVHFEEIGEMAVALAKLNSQNGMLNFAIGTFVGSSQVISEILKKNQSMIDFGNIPKEIRVELLDSFCDQMVTIIGCANMHNMNFEDALGEVNKSNWSKFDDEGNPILNEDGKVIKGPNYIRPSLDDYV